MKEIARGAEAVLFRDGKVLVKLREPKAYRLKVLDDKIRKLRTRGEARLIGRAAAAGIDVPQVIEVDEEKGVIRMKWIAGRRMKEVIDGGNSGLFQKIGEMVGRLHGADIYHGDLTTSNMILSKGKLFLIDFGLARFDKSVEGKAVDLRLLRQSLESTHWKFPKGFERVLAGYRKAYASANLVEARLAVAEARGRYNRSRRKATQ